MAKAKKQQEKLGSWIRRVWYNEEHSLPDNDQGCKKDAKKTAKKVRLVREKASFTKE